MKRTLSILGSSGSIGRQALKVAECCGHDVAAITVNASVERAEEQAQVRRAVFSLPPPDKEIFLRHYYYAQTVREVAAAMGLNESTVKTRLRRGRDKLKQLLTKEELA